jgi:murein DD-endopeptidase MepM/ murein hydrolase activator NlpD
LALWFVKNILYFNVTYKIYLKSDYKPVVRWTPDRPWYRKPRLIIWGVTGFLILFTVAMTLTISPGIDQIEAIELTPHANAPVRQPVATNIEYTSNTYQHIPVSIPASSVKQDDEKKSTSLWQTIYIAPGDNLSLIFDRMRISPAVLYKVMTASKDSTALKFLLPGQELRFLLSDEGLQTLEYDQDIVTTLQITRVDDDFVSSIIKTELRKNVKEAVAIIDSSLFLAGQRVGLSDNLIMQLVAIYGWDIDFALDIRKGDKFKLIYEEQFKGDLKVSEGPILAADFINNKKSYKSVRYEFTDGRTDYFSDSGDSMRKAFIRTPLNFSRISSKFSLTRRHPVLNTIRAHKGVDYAAPSGTPVKSAGDGTISSIGTNGGYGRVIQIKHGGNYGTLYAHLSKYARGLKKGSRVKQGQTVGYVGMSGLATGPHLHYEFRVNGVHRNPLTVQLPKAESMPKNLLADFKKKSTPLLTQLESQDKTEPLMLALKEKDEMKPSLLPENY